jgi:hypothetical protein
MREEAMHRVLFFAGCAVLAVTVPLLALGAGGRLSSGLDVQAASWTTSDVSTSSTRWHDIGALSRLSICSLGQVSATLSVTLRGAPVRFRVIIDGAPERPMRPGAAQFAPAGQESFSYTFVKGTAPFEDNDTHVFDVQWRSPTGSRVTLTSGDLNLLYQQGIHNCP